MRVPPLFQCSYKALAIRFIAFGILGVFIGECIYAVDWVVGNGWVYRELSGALTTPIFPGSPYNRTQLITNAFESIGNYFSSDWERSPWDLRMLFCAINGAIAGTLFYAALRFWATKVEKRNTKGIEIG